MLPRETTHVYLLVLLSGLLLAACGDAPEAGVTPAGEPLGTAESAVCSSLSVTTLNIADISTFQGEMAGNGGWAVAQGANAARLEYYVDGNLRSSEERTGTYNSSTGRYGGTWYFSTTGVTCGSRTFTLKAWPMVIDSAGNRTTCWDKPTSISQTVTEPCPALSASLYCSRYPDPYTSSTVRCDAWASGGTGTHNYYWKSSTTSGWVLDDWSMFFTCRYPAPGSYYAFQVQYQVKVVDSNGTEAPIQTSSTFLCEYY